MSGANHRRRFPKWTLSSRATRASSRTTWRIWTITNHRVLLPRRVGVVGDAHPRGMTVQHRPARRAVRCHPYSARCTRCTPSCSRSCTTKVFEAALVGSPNMNTHGLDVLARTSPWSNAHRGFSRPHAVLPAVARRLARLGPTPGFNPTEGCARLIVRLTRSTSLDRPSTARNTARRSRRQAAGHARPCQAAQTCAGSTCGDLGPDGACT